MGARGRVSRRYLIRSPPTCPVRAPVGASRSHPFDRRRNDSLVSMQSSVGSGVAVALHDQPSCIGFRLEQNGDENASRDVEPRGRRAQATDY